MIPVALALAALPFLCQTGAQGAAGLRATLTAPEAVEVGRPFELAVELEHAAATRPLLLPDAVGESWVVLAEHGAATRPGAEGRALTTVRWTMVALEPLEDARPELMASFPDGSLEAPYVEAGAAAGIEVLGVLAPGEDSARPPHGFRGALPAGAPAWWARWWIWGLAAAALAAAALLALRRRAPAAPPAPPTPLERLAAIDPRALSGPAEVQGAYYELTAAVRAGIDARLGLDRSGCTDEEWLRALGASGLAEEERGALEELLRASAAVKYGGAHPTQWAVQETLERARAVLEGAPGRRAEVAP